MKNITLKIKGSYVYDEVHEEDQIQLITEGKMYIKGDIIYLTYDESQLSGMEGCKTRLKLDGSSVSMTRKGSAVGIDTELRFEKGKRFSGYYDTPYGPMEMEVLTNDLVSAVSTEGFGKITIDYNISLKGVAENRNLLAIEVIGQEENRI